MKRPSSLPPGGGRKRKRVRVPTPEYLANVALYYLGRFAASEASLRRVLENRIKRAALAHEAFAADAGAQEKLRRAIDNLLEQHRKTGALNDEAYAAMKAGSMRRAGHSARRITQHLRQKGVAAEVAASALAPEEGDAGQEERKAALALAKRRRLGPFRKAADSKGFSPHELRRRDLAALARAGFSYDVAREALGGSADDDEPF